MSLDATQLEEYLRDLEAGGPQLGPKVTGRQIRAMRELLAVARGVVHVKSSHLRDSLFIMQPSALGELSESTISSTAPYAEEEAARGGAHDYPARTIEAGEGIIEGLQADLENLLLEALGAR